jgi:hypothetical protein
VGWVEIGWFDRVGGFLRLRDDNRHLGLLEEWWEQEKSEEEADEDEAESGDDDGSDGGVPAL